MNQYQAAAPATRFMPQEAFAQNNETAVYWTGSAGICINCHGTTVLVDPVLSSLEGKPGKSEMDGIPFLAQPPFDPKTVRKLDAVLYTHTDSDHMGPITAKALLASGAMFHGTPACAEALRGMGIPKERIVPHAHHSAFSMGDMRVIMTGAYHPHQIGGPNGRERHNRIEDCTGYRFETPDGIVWDPGDTLLLEEHFAQYDADLIMADFSDDPYHFGRKVSIDLFNALDHSELIMYHWGSLYAPDLGCLNADPKDIVDKLRDPGRLHILAPGEKYTLRKSQR